jgi:hypothetical protein
MMGRFRFKGEGSELPNPVAMHAAYSCWAAIPSVGGRSNTGDELMLPDRAGMEVTNVGGSRERRSAFPPEQQRSPLPRS